MSDDRQPPKGQDGERARIVVEMVRGSDPIRGSVAETGFSGWMELIDALERARRATAPRTGSRTRGERDTGG